MQTDLFLPRNADLAAFVSLMEKNVRDQLDNGTVLPLQGAASLESFCVNQVAGQTLAAG